MTQLTRRRLLAIREALNFRLAGELGDTDIPTDVYKAALEWTREKIASKPERRNARISSTPSKTGV